MNLYDSYGNPLLFKTEIEGPSLSSSYINRLKSNSDFSVDDFPLIYSFTPFSTDYSTQINTPKVLDISQSQFYSTFYDGYLGVHNGVLVTKKNLGNDQSGKYEIWCYDFLPPNAKKKILLSSGMHTYELPGSFGLARWIKEYMESSSEVFQYLRENVELCVIPIINPWGFNQNPKKYGNVNGVNPNRNFDDWNNIWVNFPDYSPNPDDPNYNEWNVKGASAFSEKETNLLVKWLKDNTDAEFWIDCHTGVGNSSKDSQGGDVWYIATSTNPNVNKLSRAADAMMEHIRSVYGTTPKKNAAIDIQNAIKQKYGTNVVGVPTVTIEQAQNSDTAYQTVPNNCQTAIKEYATQLHAFIISQLQTIT